MTENHPSDPGGLGGHVDSGQEADVLGSYLEFLRARLGGERFETLVRAVQNACALLAEEHQVLLGEPGEDEFTPAMRGEYLSLMAVMITGHLDHHLVELRTSDGAKGWAVVANARTRSGHPRPSPAARDTAQRAWIDGRFDDIARRTDSTAP